MQSPASAGQKETVVSKTVNGNIQQNTQKVKSLRVYGGTEEAAARLLQSGFKRNILSWQVLREIKRPRLLDNWMLEGGVNYIVGEAGEGKSYLAASIALKIAQYDDFEVFYIDMDNDESLPKSRGLVDIVIDKNLEDKITYINTAYLDAMRDELSEIGVRYDNLRNDIMRYAQLIYDLTRFDNKKVFIVFDSLQNLVNNINDTEEITQTMNFLHKLSSSGFTFLILHHMNKAGLYKGLSLIRDRSSSFYCLDSKNTVRDKNGAIKSLVIKAQKKRYFTSQSLTYAFKDSFEYDLIGFGITKQEAAILRIAIKELTYRDMTQGELIDSITNKLRIGRNKIFTILCSFEGHIYNVTRSLKNAKIYKLNKDSEIVKYLIQSPLEGAKRKLFDTVVAAIEAGEELKPVEVGGKVYKTYEAIKNDIYKMNDKEAERVLQALGLEYDTATDDVYDETEVETEDGIVDDEIIEEMAKQRPTL